MITVSEIACYPVFQVFSLPHIYHLAVPVMHYIYTGFPGKVIRLFKQIHSPSQKNRQYIPSGVYCHLYLLILGMSSEVGKTGFNDFAQGLDSLFLINTVSDYSHNIVPYHTETENSEKTLCVDTSVALFQPYRTLELIGFGYKISRRSGMQTDGIYHGYIFICHTTFPLLVAVQRCPQKVHNHYFIWLIIHHF